MRTLDLSAEVVSNSDLQAVPIIGGDDSGRHSHAHGWISDDISVPDDGKFFAVRIL